MNLGDGRVWGVHERRRRRGRDVGRGRGGRDGVRSEEAARLTRRGGRVEEGDGAEVTHERKRSCGWQTAAGGNDQLT